MEILLPLITGFVFLVVLIGGSLVVVARFYRKVEQGKALIVNKMKAEPEVTFTGGIVYPIIHKAEVMDISVKTIEIERRGKEGLICKDNIRADIKVAFFVRVNKTKEDVLKVAQAIGCARASDQKTLEDLFVAKFSEALKTVGKRLDFTDLYTHREEFKDQIIEVIGRDLNGYALEDAAIDFLEQTPLEMLDPENILDSVGIRKITEITAQQHVETNDLQQTERKNITRQNVEADEAILELERRKADAEARQQREIATVRAREEAETLKIQSEETRRSEIARIQAEEQVLVTELNKQRQVEVAEQDRQRVVAIKVEQVERDRSLEAISREREVELQRIDKEKALEVQRKAIADIVRTRIAVDKTVAQEEENILDLRATAGANRDREVRVIGAEAEAQERLVKDIKAAEAQERVAEFAARELLVSANAELEAADKTAQAKIRLAEGVQAEVAATGLAQVRVQEAEATAIEKRGEATARVTQGQMEAEAAGAKSKGMAEVEVREAGVSVTEREGLVTAQITQAQMVAQAEGTKAQAEAAEREGLAVATVTERQGLAEATAVRSKLVAEAEGRQADAVAVEQLGAAEASATQAKLNAEATGLSAKFEAMRAMEGVAREHEEFRLELEKRTEIELAGIAARQEIARAQAAVLAEAFSQSEIRIIGGDGQFFDRFVQAATMGQSVDALVDNSQTLQTVASGYLTGDADLPSDVKEILAGDSLSGETLKNLSIAGVLGKLMTSADGEAKAKLQALLDKAEELGL